MKKLLQISLSILSIAFVVGCGGGGGGRGGTPSEEVCQRYDDCNWLNPGYSAQQCSEEFQRALDSLSSIDRNDVELVMEDCLRFQGCESFIACMDPLVN